MVTKLDKIEMIKGYIYHYPSIKNSFKEILYENHFHWVSAWGRFGPFGSEGAWANSLTREVVRIRWSASQKMAIVYMPQRMCEKLRVFYKKIEIVEGFEPPTYDYKILAKIEQEIAEKSIEDKKI